jgi:hypothetical protein
MFNISHKSGIESMDSVDILKILKMREEKQLKDGILFSGV